MGSVWAGSFGRRLTRTLLGEHELMLRRIALVFVWAAMIGAGPKPPDPLQAFSFWIGSWTCSYTQGTQTATYAATMSWALGGNWIRERDTWASGGDEGLFTYDPSERKWSFVVVEPDRQPTLFVGKDISRGHLIFRSVYPDASMTEHIDQISPIKYTVRFSQTVGGKTTSSNDVCAKR